VLILCKLPYITQRVKPKFQLGSSRHVSTRIDTFDVSSPSRRACRAVLFQHGYDEQAIVLACTSLVIIALAYTDPICSVKSNEIYLINVYFNKSVNNLHIITLYKLHNKLSCESRLSRSSCRACRAVLFHKLDTAKMHGLDTSNCSVVSICDEPSGIWAIGPTASNDGTWQLQSKVLQTVQQYASYEFIWICRST